jgi:hypothetical protein
VLPSTPKFFLQTYDGYFFTANTSRHLPRISPHITTIGASIDQARGYKVSIACDSTDTSRGSDFRALYFQTFESDHENFQPVAQQLAWTANMREFIRRTVELVEKRRDEYETNDEFSKNLTAQYLKNY